MYIEERKVGNRVKYYLVHSYRYSGNISKIRRYLGANLSKGALKSAIDRAKFAMKRELKELNTEVFNFSLTKNQIFRLNRMDMRMNVPHLQHFDWQRFTEHFTYNTNAIEGSTVQLSEIPAILQKKKAGNAEEIETKGVAKAVDFIRSTKEDLSVDLMKRLHRICFAGSKHFAGEFRDVEVVIKNAEGRIVHVGIPAAHVKYALQEMVEWYYKNRRKFRPLVLASIIHNQFEHIHPFQDGNGRVGRLILNLILIKKRYPPIDITKEDRAEYYHSLQEYSKDMDLRPTMIFMIRQYNKTLRKVTTKHPKA